MIKIISISLVTVSVLFSSLLFAGGHSKGKTNYMWTRTFIMKPDAPTSAATKAIADLINWVNKGWPEANAAMAMPMGGNIRRVKMFYISDTVDGRINTRSQVFAHKDFPKYGQALGKYFDVSNIQDEWWILPPQGISYSSPIKN